MSAAARADLRTHYIRDPFAIETIDLGRIVQELSEASPNSDPTAWVGRTPLTEYDHVVLASDRRTGHCLGILGARDSVTEREEEFLFLRTGFVAERARGQGLLGRMIALTLLRAAGNGDVPRIIAARTNSRLFYRSLRGLAERMPGAVVYPTPEIEPINLKSAALAQRIARQVSHGIRFEASTGALRGGLVGVGGGGIPAALSPHARVDDVFDHILESPDEILALLDLRPVSEEVICEDARRVYRRH